MRSESAIQEQLSPEIPSRYTWSFPGAPLKVQLAMDLVKRLQAQLQDATPNAPKHGYLLGKIAGHTTEAVEFKAVSVPDPAAVAKIAAARPSSDTLQTV